MNQSINSWSDTLIDYLKNSNEDEIIIQNINTIISSFDLSKSCLNSCSLSLSSMNGPSH